MHQHKRKRVCENAEYLRDAFFQVWLELRNSLPHLSNSEIIRKAILSPSPEWYIPLRTALREIRIINAVGTESYHSTSPMRTRMYLDLYAKLDVLRPKLPLGLSLTKILQELLLTPAPSFYISSRTARAIIHSKLKTNKK